ncbi:MAG: nucleoside/nucleotide kinase family protein [Clostridia bacterium]|nr:nucleoside/nucleotide kinase family protein [Clostridia bacterium]
MDVIEYNFEVNGFDVAARYDRAFLDETVVPLIRRFAGMRQKAGRGIVVFLAAPPAAGKSTLAQLFMTLSSGIVPLQALGMDGFHYHQSYLESHEIVRAGETIPLYKVKGGPESFDVAKLNDKLRRFISGERIKWPFYDRRLHDVVEDAIEVDAEIAFVEGNWLLLKDDIWKETSKLCDYSITLTAPGDMLRDRLISRKMKGGATKDEAHRHYEFNDEPNIRRFLSDSARGDLVLTMDASGAISMQ